MTNLNQLTIVMYHYVRPIKNSKYPYIKGLEFEGFKRQLDYLSSKYSLITAEELINYSRGGGDLPKNACYLTFDDGYKDHIDFVMPELLLRKMQGSFFPPADAIEKRSLLDVNAIHFILASTIDYKGLVNELNIACLENGLNASDLNLLHDKWSVASKYDPPEIMFVKHMLQHALSKDIRLRIISTLFKKYVGETQIDFAEKLYLSHSDTKELVNNGMYVGSHGCKHVWLDKETKSDQLDEINLSLKFLEKVGARTNDWIMCYPYGAYNDDTLNILKSSNCAIGLTTQEGFANLNKSNMLELSRFDTNDFPQ
jgi:peptidoglycan/xylan/chitin deacetylase (PgdA/CDA1 family)